MNPLMTRRISQCLAIAALSLASPARGGEPLVTDRPDTAESSQTVGAKRFQMETSFSFSHDRDVGTTTRTYNFPTLLRYGVNNPVEIRLEGNMLGWQTVGGGPAANGFNDLAVGFKVHLRDQKDWVPSSGVLVHLTLPTGTGPFSSNALQPEVKYLADWDLPADFSLGTNWGFDLPEQDAQGDKFLRFLYAVAAGHAMPIWSEHWNIFAEFAGTIPTVSAKAAEHHFDTGFTFLLSDDMQLDTFVEIGLNRSTPDLTTGLGFSWRLL